MIERMLYLLSFIVGQLDKALKRKEQREAQDERDQIDQDSAQHSADKFGDGRVRPIPRDATEADKAKQRDSNGG